MDRGPGAASGPPRPTILSVATWCRSGDWGFKAELACSRAPDCVMHQGAQLCCSQSRARVLYNDLNACNSYQGALARGPRRFKVPHVRSRRSDTILPANAGKTLGRRRRRTPARGAAGRRHMMNGRVARRIARRCGNNLILRSADGRLEGWRHTGSHCATPLRVSSSGSVQITPRRLLARDGMNSDARGGPYSAHPCQACGRCVAVEHSDQVVDA